MATDPIHPPRSAFAPLLQESVQLSESVGRLQSALHQQMRMLDRLERRYTPTTPYCSIAADRMRALKQAGHF
ncbi:hypothetical protein [Methylobacterium sp. WL9]|uniref:hypothetical protein n=1 Tax=Methylobacterium sp. WL9 TaxID=2603898 RepID=UPI0011CCCF9F|nr:hypothetical protein [Methylobacterium sp. WL9]TXN21534.1 hypothetical protein FV217_14075 [Methylobacterium sp. WL9]